MKLKIGVVPEEKCMVVHMMVLREEDEKGIDLRVWAEEGGHRLLNIPLIENKMKPDLPPIRIKQYPISVEGK